MRIEGAPRAESHRAHADSISPEQTCSRPETYTTVYVFQNKTYSYIYDVCV